MDQKIWPAEGTTRGACFIDVLENIETATSVIAWNIRNAMEEMKMEHKKSSLKWKPCGFDKELESD